MWCRIRFCTISICVIDRVSVRDLIPLHFLQAGDYRTMYHLLQSKNLLHHRRKYTGTLTWINLRVDSTLNSFCSARRGKFSGQFHVRFILLFKSFTYWSVWVSNSYIFHNVCLLYFMSCFLKLSSSYPRLEVINDSGLLLISSVISLSSWKSSCK